MKVSRRSLRWLGVAGAAVLVASTAATASAATPASVNYSWVSYNQYQNQVTSYNYTADGSAPLCTANSSTPPNGGTLTANAGPQNFTSTVNGTVTANADNTDVSTVAMTDHATFNMITSTSHPFTMTGSFTGSGSNTLSHASSVCDVEAQAGVEGDAYFTTAQPNLVTINVKAAGNGQAEVSIGDSYGSYFDASVVGGHPQMGVDGSGALHTVFLPAGSYSVSIIGGVNLPAKTSADGTTNYASTTSGTGSASITFTPAGARIAGPSGNARSYVSMGAARSCAAHTLVSHVTGARTYASQIQTVTVLANGRALKKVYRPLAGASLTVALPNTQTEKVVMAVVLRNGKHLSETATYLRCS